MRPPTFLRAPRVLLACILVAIMFVPGREAGAQGADLARGTAHFDAGDPAAARADFEAALREDPRNATALYYIGRVALQQDHSGEAVDWLEKAIAVDDRNADYHVWLGVALGAEAQRASRLRQPFLARRVKSEFERAVALDPRSVTARYGLVEFYAFAPGFLGGGIDKARAQAAELQRVSPVNGYLAAGFIDMREKDTVAMIRDYEGAIAVAPDSTTGYLSLGALYERMERWTEAFATFDHGLARRPDDPALLFQLGRTAALSGRNLDRGEQALRKWLASPPRNPPLVTTAAAHHRLGQVLEHRGQRDAARAEYQEALRINPKNDDARTSLAALK